MTAASAVIVHRIPGRIRLRLQGKRSDSDYFETLSEDITGMPGIDAVKVNPMTGSVVIHYSGTTDDVLARLEEHHFSIANRHEIEKTREKKREKNQQNTSSPNAGYTQPFLLVSDRDINPMFMLGTMLAAFGVIQTFRGKILVPSLSLLWYAMEAFRQSRAPHSPRTAADSMEGHQAGLHQGPGSDDLVH
jgi:cation transport ATPase